MRPMIADKMAGALQPGRLLSLRAVRGDGPFSGSPEDFPRHELEKPTRCGQLSWPNHIRRARWSTWRALCRPRIPVLQGLALSGRFLLLGNHNERQCEQSQQLESKFEARGDRCRSGEPRCCLSPMPKASRSGGHARGYSPRRHLADCNRLHSLDRSGSQALERVSSCWSELANPIWSDSKMR